MPKRAPGGSETVELLEYLIGPGERDEHTDPHLVAAWDPDLPCPARDPGRMSLAGLALLLDAPVEALRGPRPAEHVWHVSVRNHAGDRTLSDAEWAEVAAAMVHAAGIAARGDEHACRWVAVRHADDHIHIAATLARQDGRHPRVRGDIPNMHTAARLFEARWGLAEMSPLDRTARRRPLTGEAEKAARRGLAETARESLQRTVRTAAALAHDDADFLDRLRDAGLRVRERHGDDGTLVGYAVALPGDRADRGSRPVWFAGSTLAYDLSLPRVRERYEPLVTDADWALAEHRIREAAPPPVATTLFSLTERGRELEPVLQELSRWGVPLLREPDGSDTFRTHWLDMPARALTDHRPDQPAIALQLHADGNEDLVIEVKDGAVHTHAGRVDHPTASLTGPPHLLAATLLGDLDLSAAVQQGLQLSGEREAVLRILPR
ncbi:hypothetical protein AVW11_34645 [Streptomyces amritsarensis]|uniref:Mobilization protein n=1 Tax=Streptomyces amritsarensis TaxID=681158 RepID=A0ABX3FUQ5_9ACTN|nr:hypothetical protein [Streptomyces amritsarensis]OLZ45093.1 hypothetical protein AVW11_34645 [Streptomyces amritsarensis]